jgi:hypothetical protein
MPLAIGKKVFVACAPGWPAGQDCAVLLCFDGDTGKELWRRDLDEFASLPAEEAKELRALRREYYQSTHAINRLAYEWKSADETRKAAICEEIGGKHGLTECAKNPEKFLKPGYQGICAGTTERLLGLPRFKKLSYPSFIWGPTCLDITMPNPVSDGRRVYIVTGRRSVHAFDLDGRQLWHTYQPDAPFPYQWTEDLANAPLIADGKFLMHCWDHLWAWDLDTGRLVWKTASKTRFRHGMGWPQLLRLKAPDGKMENFAYLWTGDLVRLRDGKILQGDVMYPHFPSMISDRAQTLYISTMAEGCVEHSNIKNHPVQIPPKGKQGTRALHFAYEGSDKVVWKELWFNNTIGLGSYPTILEDRVMNGGASFLNRQDGTQISPKPAGRVSLSRFCAYILANGHAYGLGDDGCNIISPKDSVLTCHVTRITADTVTQRLCPVEAFPATITAADKLAQVIALTGQDQHWRDYCWSSGFQTPFASGNRLFIRTFNFLYCFGDKNQPFVPSKAFSETSAP